MNTLAIGDVNEFAMTVGLVTLLLAVYMQNFAVKRDVSIASTSFRSIRDTDEYQCSWFKYNQQPGITTLNVTMNALKICSSYLMP